MGSLAFSSGQKVTNQPDLPYNQTVEQSWTIILEPCKEGGFTARIAEVPGAISEGKTEEEAREMVMEALHEILELRREQALANKKPGAVIFST